jgi:hypothetical protein
MLSSDGGLEEEEKENSTFHLSASHTLPQGLNRTASDSRVESDGLGCWRRMGTVDSDSKSFSGKIKKFSPREREGKDIRGG